MPDLHQGQGGNQRYLVTVGLVHWSLDGPGMASGFVPEEVAPELDFIAVHLYPEKGKVKEALEALSGFAVGEPLIIEETFVLKCSAQEFEQFLDGSRNVASGWIGFYWGTTPEEYRQAKTLRAAFMLSWLEIFQKRAGEVVRSSGSPKQLGDLGTALGLRFGGEGKVLAVGLAFSGKGGLEVV